MAYTPFSSSVVAFQSDPNNLVAKVSVVSHSPQSVATLQGTNPWIVNAIGSVATAPQPGSVSGVGIFNVNHIGAGSIQTVSLGSIATQPFPASVSGVGTFNVSPVGGSILTYSYQAPGSILAVEATVETGNSSVQLLVGTAMIGSVAAYQGTTPWAIGNSSVQVNNIVTGNSSVYLIPGVGVLGSVATLQGTNPWIVNATGSIATAPLPGSVSGVGLFNVNHVGVGSIFTGFRNDTVASTLGVDLTSRLKATDSAGRTLVKPFAPEQARVYGVASTVNTNPSSLIAAAGAGLRNYITDLLIANTGSVATLVSFRDVDASVLGRTIAPGGGGSNIIHFATPMRTHALASQVEYTAQTAVSVLHVTAFGYTAP